MFSLNALHEEFGKNLDSGYLSGPLAVLVFDPFLELHFSRATVKIRRPLTLSNDRSVIHYFFSSLFIEVSLLRYLALE